MHTYMRRVGNRVLEPVSFINEKNETEYINTIHHIIHNLRCAHTYIYTYIYIHTYIHIHTDLNALMKIVVNSLSGMRFES